ncbi:MAG: zinc ribbon domain-containing protein [Pseudobutyrivibrio sp.]|nr:zinc ribbon domain-containing protein [Pseudobutyrivibrio sp.]
MAFCSKCGQQVADGLTVCPACGAPIEAPAAAPQTPNYAVASPKEKLDFIPSSASASFPTFAYMAIAGYGLSMIGGFIGTANTDINDLANLGKPNLLGVIFTLLGAFLVLVGMFKFYDALKKGLVGHKAPCTGLCSAATILMFIFYGLTLLSTFVMILSFNSSSGGGFLAGLAGGVLGILVGIAYIVVVIVLGAKLLSNYEGNVNKIGLWLLLTVAVGIIPFVGAIAAVVFSVLLFLTAIKAISPAK